MIYDFELMCRDEVMAEVHIDTEKNESSIKKFVTDPRQWFQCDREDIDYIYMLLEDRYYDVSMSPERIEALKWTGIARDVYAYCRETHAVSAYDDDWIRFPGEKLTWRDVNRWRPM